MTKKMKKWIAGVLTLVMAMSMMCATVLADTTEYSQEAYTDILEVLDAATDGSTDSTNAWRIMTLARAGRLSQEKADAYYANLTELVNQQGNVDAYTGNLVAALAVTSIGKDATNVGNGINLLDPIADDSYIQNGVNYATYALLAVDSNNYEIPTVAEGGTQTTRDSIIQYLLDSALATGGWDPWGYGVDIDTTAMIVQALAPYYSRTDVATVVDNAMNVLSSMQADSGSYQPYGYDNTCSVAQVLTALSSLGANPVTDSRFIKGENNLLTGIMICYQENTGFISGYTGQPDLDYDTTQAAYALTAYNRYANGKNTLYDMTDGFVAYVVSNNDSEASSETATSEASTTESTTEQKDNSPQTGDAVPLALVTGLLFCAMAGLVGKRLYVSREGK